MRAASDIRSTGSEWQVPPCAVSLRLTLDNRLSLACDPQRICEAHIGQILAMRVWLSMALTPSILPGNFRRAKMKAEKEDLNCFGTCIELGSR
jgi:hypothetical protein